MSLTGFLSYSRVNWQQSPSKSTPLSAANLNLMDAGIKNNNDMISNIRDEITQLNSNFNIKEYSLELSSENTINNISTLILSYKHRFLLIEYGKKNFAQSYGGNTTLLSCNDNKPCFVPVYLNSITPSGLLYFNYDILNNKFNSYVVNNNNNLTYLVKIIGIG